MPASPDSCRRYRARLKQRAENAVGSCCSFCGSTSRLEFAHIVPTAVSGHGRGNIHRYRDVLRNPTKYRRLCHDCHTEYDRTITRQCRELSEIPD